MADDNPEGDDDGEILFGDRTPQSYDFYDILNIDRSATQEDVSRAYRR